MKVSFCKKHIGLNNNLVFCLSSNYFRPFFFLIKKTKVLFFLIFPWTFLLKIKCVKRARVLYLYTILHRITSFYYSFPEYFQFCHFVFWFKTFHNLVKDCVIYSDWITCILFIFRLIYSGCRKIFTNNLEQCTRKWITLSILN